MKQPLAISEISAILCAEYPDMDFTLKSHDANQVEVSLWSETGEMPKSESAPIISRVAHALKEHGYDVSWSRQFVYVRREPRVLPPPDFVEYER